MPQTKTLTQYLQQITALKESGRREREARLKGGHSNKNNHDRTQNLIHEVQFSDIGSSNGQTAQHSLLDKAVKAFARNRHFLRFELGRKDLLVVAGIFQQIYEDFDFDLRAREVIGMVGDELDDIRSRGDYLASLVEREIISLTYTCREDYHRSSQILLESSICLNSYFLSLLLGRDPIAESVAYLKRRLPSAPNSFEVLSGALKIFGSQYREFNGEQPEYGGWRYGRTVNELLDRFLDVVNRLPQEHHLRTFISSNQLAPLDLKILLLVYHFEFKQNDHFELGRLANLLSTTEEEFEAVIAHLSESSPLPELGFVNQIEPGPLSQNVRLKDKAVSELDHRPPAARKGHMNLEQMVRKSGNMLLLQTSQNLGQLVLPCETIEVLRATITRLKDPKRFDLSRWGLLPCSLTDASEALNGCALLLHGQPGTGKTFVAGVIANELGRRLVQLDANCLRDCYYGETEKRIKKLFKKMREVIAGIDPAPVFLLNEADQLIHARGQIRGSCDNTENTIQSIFLEEMETFPGILIVTTNLAENLDPAMSRRFTYKLEFTLPDREARERLWRLHLPPTVPGAGDIDHSALARSYRFSGGQIRLVVQNACYQAMLREENPILTMEDLVRHAELESCGNFEHKTAGFCIDGDSA
jgi:hypothetical protein